jgi:atypical dual specificity phosphatase
MTFSQLIKFGSLSRQAWNYARLALKPVTWIEDGCVAACGYPRGERSLRQLDAAGVRLLVNLHPRAHPPHVLARLELKELHLPVVDFTAPSQEQLAQGVQAMSETVSNGAAVAVHCGAGLGRTGTLVACYLVAGGLSAEDAIAKVRRLRPGSIETAEQEAAVRTFEGRIAR